MRFIYPAVSCTLGVRRKHGTKARQVFQKDLGACLKLLQLTSGGSNLRHYHTESDEAKVTRFVCRFSAECRLKPGSNGKTHDALLKNPLEHTCHGRSLGLYPLRGKSPQVGGTPGFAVSGGLFGPRYRFH